MVSFTPLLSVAGDPANDDGLQVHHGSEGRGEEKTLANHFLHNTRSIGNRAASHRRLNHDWLVVDNVITL